MSDRREGRLRSLVRSNSEKEEGRFGSREGTDRSLVGLEDSLVCDDRSRV